VSSARHASIYDMKQMQLRSGMEEIKLIIKALENTPPHALTPHENIESAELAFRLRWRAVKLWGAQYDDDSPATAPLRRALAAVSAEKT
jgi:hypothetical protein